jgi:hypothetical protein
VCKGKIKNRKHLRRCQGCVQRKTKHSRRDVKNLCKGNTKRTTTLINRGAVIKTTTLLLKPPIPLPPTRPTTTI